MNVEIEGDRDIEIRNPYISERFPNYFNKIIVHNYIHSQSNVLSTIIFLKDDVQVEPIDRPSDTCAMLMPNYHNDHIDLVNNVRKGCQWFHQYNNDSCPIMTTEQKRQYIINVFQSFYPTYSKHSLPYKIYITDVEPGKEFLTLLIYYVKYNNTLFQGFITDADGQWNYHITYKDQSGVGIGVIKNFFSNAIKQMHELGLFVPTETGSTRYEVNNNLKLSDDVIQYLKSNIWIIRRTNINIYEEVYLTAGGLCVFAIMNKLPIALSLAHSYYYYIVYNLPMNNLDNTSIVPHKNNLYYLNSINYKESFKSNVGNLIKLSYNELDELDLPYDQSGNDTINRNNFLQFVDDKIFTDLLGLPVSRYSSETSIKTAYIKSFITSFQYYFNALAHISQLTIQDLDNLFSSSGISDDLIVALADSINVRASNATIDVKIVDNITIWMKNIIRGSATLPREEVNRIDKLKGKSDEEVHKDFIEKLMGFWSSVYTIDLSNNYVVYIFDYTKIMKSDGTMEYPKTRYPIAHTCFKILDLDHRISSENELYTLLLTSVYEVESGMGLYGGKKYKLATLVTKTDFIHRLLHFKLF